MLLINLGCSSVVKCTARNTQMKELYCVAKVDKGNLIPPSKIRIKRQSLMKIWLL